MSITWDGLINGITFLGSPQGDGVGGTCAGRHGIGEPSSHHEDIPTAHTGAETQAAQSDSRSFASPAPASEDALAGTGGGDSFPSSPLHKSGDGRFDSDNLRGTALQAGDVSSNLTPAASVAGWANGKPPAVIHTGKTIERLISAVVVCEERAR